PRRSLRIDFLSRLRREIPAAPRHAAPGRVPASPEWQISIILTVHDNIEDIYTRRYRVFAVPFLRSTVVPSAYRHPCFTGNIRFRAQSQGRISKLTPRRLSTPWRGFT